MTIPKGQSAAASHRLPVERWARLWLLAILLTVVVLGAWEAFLRSRRIVPTVASRTSVWVTARYRVRATSTVAGGTSRMLSALDPEAWAASFGGEPAIQLSVLGGSTIRLLEHLADSPSFHGLVVADIAPFYTFDADSTPTRLVDERVATYELARLSPAQRIETFLRTWIPSRFAFRRPELEPGQVARVWAAGGPLPRPPVEVRPDGWAPLDFRGTGTPANTARIMSPESFERLASAPPDSATFEAQLSRLASAVERLRARGAGVVLVYMPGCGGRKIMEERRFPKARYWAAVRSRVAALTIDVEDFPGAPALPCYDGSHLDRADAGPVTTWLAAQVRARLPRQAPAVASAGRS